MNPPIPLESEVSLAAHTTLSVGGPARWFARVSNVADLNSLLHWADQSGVPAWILGEGSNVLVSDSGFDGVVIRLALHGVHALVDGDRVMVRAAAGESWDAFVAHAVDHGWAGIECLSGIPGTVGAAPVQNIGAYGQELSETIDSVETFDPQTGRPQVFSREACEFSYRTSRFKRGTGDRHVITAVTFALRSGPPAPARYPELAAALEGEDPALAGVRRAVLAIRKKKSMVLDATDENRRSAGSFFMNPIVDARGLWQVRAVAADRGLPDPPAYAQSDGSTKLSAAWLVERAGFSKGWGDGPAGLSTKHCLALVNRGGASAADLVRVAAAVRRGVRSTFGVTLSPEPRFVGFGAPVEAILEAF